MWLVVCREYNEDPIVRTMLPATWLSARRRTILLFYKPDGSDSVERLVVARYGVEGLFEPAWDPEEQPDQWARLVQLIEERDPSSIAVNISENFAHADGISATELGALRHALPEKYQDRVVSGDRLAVGWLETRLPEEVDFYPSYCSLAHDVIREGLTGRIVNPGKTTTADLQWWYREKIQDLGLNTWFHPSASIQRHVPDQRDQSLLQTMHSAGTFEAGDLIHVDIGLSYLGLHTDNQHLGYILRDGETDAPPSLAEGMKQANRLQDIVCAQFATGRTGNEVLRRSREIAQKEGMEPSIYCHPLGMHGHAAGATIGLWDQQDGVSGSGDYPIFPDTVWSVELNVTVSVPEWGGQKVLIPLEEDAFFDGERLEYIDGRQTAIRLIGD